MVNPLNFQRNSRKSHRDSFDNGLGSFWVLSFNCSLNKIPRKRPTFNALLEHPWLLPLSPTRPDFAQVEASNREMLGQWVRESIAKRKEKEGTAAAEETRAKPPLHAVKKEAEETA